MVINVDLERINNKNLSRTDVDLGLFYNKIYTTTTIINFTIIFNFHSTALNISGENDHCI